MSRVASDWNEADSQELLENGRLFDAKGKRRAFQVTQDGVLDLNGFIQICRSQPRPFGFSSTAGIGG